MITWNVSEDAEHMAKAAREVLTRPSNSAMWDDRLYTTHGPVISWADRGDDILAESNYHAALNVLNGAVAHDETGASEERGDDVIDASISDWLVGSLRQIFVRVYTDDTRTAYTPAFKAAVEMAWRLDQYPILDESDYSQRETEAREDVISDALDAAARDHYTDTEAEVRLFRDAVWNDDREHDSIGWHPDEVDYDTVARLYAEARDAHFNALASEYPMVPWPWPLPGAERLPGL